jgi:hypothetical protein
VLVLLYGDRVTRPLYTSKPSLNFGSQSGFPSRSFVSTCRFDSFCGEIGGKRRASRGLHPNQVLDKTCQFRNQFFKKLLIKKVDHVFKEAMEIFMRMLQFFTKHISPT